jgi:deoxyadenosine/deoxycytidine kinase
MAYDRGLTMFLLEGNIGVGKSTFLHLLKQKCPQITAVEEPLENWATQKYGKSLLESFYYDPNRWAYTIETLAMMARVRDHIREQARDPRKIMERSVYSGHYCFAKNGYENGYFSVVEWEIYEKWATFLLHSECKIPRGFIYLQSQPETCYNRVLKRHRSGEGLITLDYLQSIHKKHDQFLLEKKDIHASLKYVPVLVLDCDQDFENNELLFQEYIDKIKTFIEKNLQDIKQTKHTATIQ